MSDSSIPTTSLTFSKNVSGIPVGAVLSGPGVASGTLVVALLIDRTSDTTLYLSQPASVTKGDFLQFDFNVGLVRNVQVIEY